MGSADVHRLRQFSSSCRYYSTAKAVTDKTIHRISLLVARGGEGIMIDR
jgi:hypothetical protein